LNNLPSIDSDFSDFEKDTIYSIHFDPKHNTKTLVQASKYSATFKFKSHNKWLCVKLLNEEYVTNGMYIDTFENEFTIGFELNHPNIIQYYKLVKTVDTVYILKEYVDGIALKDYLNYHLFFGASCYFIAINRCVTLFTFEADLSPGY
jgi:serine/threonine protein kinase